MHKNSKVQTSKSLIIGAGAIGSLLGALLEEAGFDFNFLVKVDSTQSTLKIKTPDAEYDFSNKIFRPKDLKQSKFDFIFITVKAFDVIEALKTSRIFANTHTLVVCLANGYYHRQLPQDYLQSPFSRVGICTFGVTNESHGEFVLRSNTGKILWGPTIQLKTEANLPEKPLLDRTKEIEFKKDIYPDIAQKWIFNCTINTISAACNLNKNIEILSNMSLLNAVYSESYELGKKIFPTTPLPTKDQLFLKLKELISATSDNENSMQRDLRERRNTEIDFLAGLGCSAGNFPVLKNLVDVIKNK